MRKLSRLVRVLLAVLATLVAGAFSKGRGCVTPGDMVCDPVHKSPDITGQDQGPNPTGQEEPKDQPDAQGR